MHYILVAKYLKGNHAGQWTLIGSLKKESLFATIEMAMEALDSASAYLHTLRNVDLDINTLTIAEVKIPTVDKDPKIISL